MIQIFNQYTSLRLLALMTIDAVSIFTAFFLSARAVDAMNRSDLSGRLIVEGLLMLVMVQTAFYCNDLYDLSRPKPRKREIFHVIQSIAGVGLIAALCLYVVPRPAIEESILIRATGLAVTLVCLVRVGMSQAWTTALAAQKVVVLGTGDLAGMVARELTARKDLNVALLGFVGVATGETLPAPFLGPYDDLGEIALEHGITRIIVAMEDWRGALPLTSLMRLRVRGVVVEDAHSALAALTGRVWLVAVRPSWLTLFVFSGGFRRSRLRAWLKRLGDLISGVLGLVITCPIQLAVALAIVFESGRPAIYRQTRVGYRGKPFELLKFRSMRTDAESEGLAQWSQPNDPRVTRVGRFIRKYRLDELPQFFNVIRGDMSFVGPRPERPYFVEKLRERLSYYDLRHMVRPGITGWAQVRDTYASTVEDSLRKLEYDLFYLKNMSFLFDCSIVFQSVRTVLLGKGGW